MIPRVLWGLIGRPAGETLDVAQGVGGLLPEEVSAVGSPPAWRRARSGRVGVPPARRPRSARAGAGACGGGVGGRSARGPTSWLEGPARPLRPRSPSDNDKATKRTTHQTDPAAAIVTAIRQATSPGTAAALAGINRASLYWWLRHGHQSPDTKLGRFLRQVNRALALAEHRQLVVVRQPARPGLSGRRVDRG